MVKAVVRQQNLTDEQCADNETSIKIKMINLSEWHCNWLKSVGKV